MDAATMGVLADAGVFGALQAPTPTSAGNDAQQGGFSMGGNFSGNANGTPIVMLIALGLLGVVYWQTRGLQH